MLFIKEMSKKDARKISSWRYEPPYAIYSMNCSAECISELLSSSYYAVKDKAEELIGFYCFGQAAQVPAGNVHGAYEDKNFIDIGLGMRPDLCGKGRGYEFLIKEIEFANALYGEDKLRLTVAEFNKRAVRLYEKAGFKTMMDFNRTNDKGTTKFLVMKFA
jgi:[ribosomal protein S18]-alanine N-acetyltransferase